MTQDGRLVSDGLSERTRCDMATRGASHPQRTLLCALPLLVLPLLRRRRRG